LRVIHLILLFCFPLFWPPKMHRVANAQYLFCGTSYSPFLKTIMAILKCNIRGIRNRVKRRSIFSYLKDQNCHFYLLQETFSEPKDERAWKNEWGCDVFLSHGSNHSKGVSILVSPSIVVNVGNSYEDIDGRIIAIDVICNGVNLSICNVYAPTSCQSQGKFL